MSASTLSVALWCSVMPRVQQIMPFFARAKSSATSRIAAAGTPVSASARSRV